VKGEGGTRLNYPAKSLSAKGGFHRNCPVREALALTTSEVPTRATTDQHWQPSSKLAAVEVKKTTPLVSGVRLDSDLCPDSGVLADADETGRIRANQGEQVRFSGSS
jgi:hypothetical protein